MFPKSPVTTVEKDQIRRLSRLLPHRTALKFIEITLAFCLAFLLAHLGTVQPFFPFYILAFLTVTWVQHAVFEELHEGAHYRLASSRRLNEYLAGFYGSLMGISLDNFRVRHHMHHRHFGTPRDPDLPQYQTCPSGVKGWLQYIAVNFTGYGAITSLLGAQSTLTTGQPSWQHPGFTLVVQFVVFVIGVLVGQPFFYFAFWFAPLITLTYGISHFRTLLEHYNPQTWQDPATGETCYGAFYDFQAGIQRHLLGAQFGYNYHGSHHTEPSVPNYNLNQIAHEDYREVPETLIRTTTYFHRMSEILSPGYEQ